MNSPDYNKIMIETAKFLWQNGDNKRLLLHSCCAPCSTSCIERVKDYFNVTVFYYNPNIDTLEEFEKRKKEQERYAEKCGIDCISEKHCKQDFLDVVFGLECEKEGGKRCEKCFYLRLKKTAEVAKEKGFDYFTTTLTVSPLKNAKLINQIGIKVQEEIGVKFLPSDFKKQNGYKRSVELSNANEMYRQNYCGCEFSKR